MLRPRREFGVRRHDESRTFIGFAIVGVVNSVLPYLVHTANYLIIPFPRPVVIVLELLPALLVKVLFPQLLRTARLPYSVRPFIFSACWLLTWIVTWATPPNVDPVFRVLMTVLAAATAAGTEVSALGQLRYYGVTGLAGWGFGTGLGGIIVAGLPAYLTIFKGQALRDSIEEIWKLAIIIPMAFLLVIPDRSTYATNTDDVDMAATSQAKECHPFEEPTNYAQKRAVSETIKQNLSYVGSLLKPYIIPLFAAFAIQAVVFPGITRTLDTYLWGDFLRYKTAYGMSLQGGSLIARTSIIFHMTKRTKLLHRLLYLAFVLAVLNASFLFTTSVPIVIAFFVGSSAGAVYVNLLALVLERVHDLETQEFTLGIIGAGETAGLLVGGLVGAILENRICSQHIDGSRWCHYPR